MSQLCLGAARRFARCAASSSASTAAAATHLISIPSASAATTASAFGRTAFAPQPQPHACYPPPTPTCSSALLTVPVRHASSAKPNADAADAADAAGVDASAMDAAKSAKPKRSKFNLSDFTSSITADASGADRASLLEKLSSSSAIANISDAAATGSKVAKSGRAAAAASKKKTAATATPAAELETAEYDDDDDDSLAMLHPATAPVTRRTVAWSSDASASAGPAGPAAGANAGAKRGSAQERMRALAASFARAVRSGEIHRLGQHSAAATELADGDGAGADASVIGDQGDGAEYGDDDGRDGDGGTGPASRHRGRRQSAHRYDDEEAAVARAAGLPRTVSDKLASAARRARERTVSSRLSAEVKAAAQGLPRQAQIGASGSSVSRLDPVSGGELPSHKFSKPVFASPAQVNKNHSLPDREELGLATSQWGIQLVLEYLKTQKLARMVVFDTSGVYTHADHVIIATAPSARAMSNLGQRLVKLARMYNAPHLHRMGASADPDGLWVPVALGPLVVHLCTQEGRVAPMVARMEQRLLRDAPIIPYPQWHTIKDPWTVMAERIEATAFSPLPAHVATPPPGYFNTGNGKPIVVRGADDAAAAAETALDLAEDAPAVAAALATGVNGYPALGDEQDDQELEFAFYSRAEAARDRFAQDMLAAAVSAPGGGKGRAPAQGGANGNGGSKSAKTAKSGGKGVGGATSAAEVESRSDIVDVFTPNDGTGASGSNGGAAAGNSEVETARLIAAGITVNPLGAAAEAAAAASAAKTRERDERRAVSRGKHLIARLLATTPEQRGAAAPPAYNANKHEAAFAARVAAAKAAAAAAKLNGGASTSSSSNTDDGVVSQGGKRAFSTHNNVLSVRALGRGIASSGSVSAAVSRGVFAGSRAVLAHSKKGNGVDDDDDDIDGVDRGFFGA